MNARQAYNQRFSDYRKARRGLIPPIKVDPFKESDPEYNAYKSLWHRETVDDYEQGMWFVKGASKRVDQGKGYVTVKAYKQFFERRQEEIDRERAAVAGGDQPAKKTGG